MTSSRSIILLVTFLSPLAVAPASFCAAEGGIRFGHLGVDQGLSDNGVFAIHQDTRGFMWFGTENGLNRYDGYHFTVYRHNDLDSQSISIDNVPQVFEDRSGTLWIRGPAGNDLNRFDRTSEQFTPCLPNTYVSSIYEDAHGTLWFATQGRGLFRYEKANATFVHYSVACDTLVSPTICGNPADGDQTLFVGTSHGVVAFDQQEGTSGYLQGGPRGAVTAMVGDRAGNVWIGTREGLYAFNCTTRVCSFYPFGIQIRRNTGGNEIRLLYEDREGLLWIGIAGARVALFDPTTGKYRHFPDAGYQASWPNQGICEDRTGAIWVSTTDRGVQKFDRRTGSFSTYQNDPGDPQSLSRNLANCIYEDRSGTLWIGTWGGGLNTIDPAQKAFHHYTLNGSAQKGLEANVVSGFTEDHSGMLWITTMGGLTKFDRATELFTHYRHDPKDPHSLSTNATWAVLEDREGFLWVAAQGQGLDRLDPSRKQFTHYRHDQYLHDPRNSGGLGSNTVFSLCEDKAGGLWVGTADGTLDRLDRHTGTIAHYRDSLQGSDEPWVGVVWALYEDRQGSIWICAGAGGLASFDRKTGSFIHYQNEPNNPFSLSPNSIRSIHEDAAGMMWVGTVAGLNKFDRSRGTFVRFTVRDGLESDHLGTILHDDHGCLWMSTTRGISKFDPRTGKFSNYNEDDGITIHPFMTQFGYRTRNGEMYFGGTNGFVRFHPDSIEDNPYVPPVVITRLLISDRPATLDTVISEKKGITLSHDEDSFAFEFAALNYTNPGKNQYAYKLEGFDNDWIQAGTRRYASYTHLDPGRYVFTVRGSNNDGKRNDAGTSVFVIIRPPYWQTWWFRSLVAALFIALVTLAYNYRVRKLLEMERLRVRISTDLHDEIGSNLSAIALQSDLVRSGVGTGNEGTDRLVEISRSARQMTNDLRDIVWTINPGLDRVDDVVERMRAIAAAMLSGTTYSFEGEAGSSSERLEMEFRRHLLLMYKEVLHNIQKHAHATQVSIRATREAGCFTVTIDDNGVGFDTALPSSGYGLSSLKGRARAIGAALEIVSERGRGTRVKIAVRIP